MKSKAMTTNTNQEKGGWFMHEHMDECHFCMDKFHFKNHFHEQC
jgi:hypothetical protein